MITNKYIDKIISVIVAFAVVFCFAAKGFSEELIARAGGNGVSMEYETKLFDTGSPISVNILMDDSDWQDMLNHASSENYYECDVQINGQTFCRVGIRPKGNTSLSAIAMNPETDRYSFKLEFDQYVDGQTCYGLDKLILNNNYADATNMKEALVYDMYQYIGADASLYNYASIYVNGEYWGIYLALEAVEDSFLLRNYGAGSGKLYKPEGMGMGSRGDFDSNGAGLDNFRQPSIGENIPIFDKKDVERENLDFGDFNPDSIDSGGPDFVFDGFSAGGNGGANLNYSDDDLDSYSTIWEGEITGSNKSDHRRVMKALKNISEGNDLERYMDVDNLLKYMAVHVFSVNDDSLTGSMAHNYYLYEKDGKLNLIPWDYNLAFGGMMGGNNASDVINDAIDGAFTGTKFFDKLMGDEEYAEQYHIYLQQLVEEYMNGGAFEEFYSRTRTVLDELVKTDPTAFYTYKEYTDAADTLYEVVRLRGKSILGQIDGTIPSTQSGQRDNSSGLVDTGDIDLSIMGTMSMGNGDMGGGGGFGGFGGGFHFGSEFIGRSGFEPSSSDGKMSEGFDSLQSGTPSDSVPDEKDDGSPANNLKQEESAAENDKSNAELKRPDRGDMDFDEFSGKRSGEDFNSTVINNLMTYGISFSILIAALIFATLFRRRSRRKVL